ncbi:MAG TPA: hypothetical protein V6C72_10065, partial [Chroococcales cyanobacterium]
NIFSWILMTFLVGAMVVIAGLIANDFRTHPTTQSDLISTAYLVAGWIVGWPILFILIDKALGSDHKRLSQFIKGVAGD